MAPMMTTRARPSGPPVSICSLNETNSTLSRLSSSALILRRVLFFGAAVVVLLLRVPVLVLVPASSARACLTGCGKTRLGAW
jgi:hypothetical protein